MKSMIEGFKLGMRCRQSREKNFCFANTRLHLSLLKLTLELGAKAVYDLGMRGNPVNHVSCRVRPVTADCLTL